MNNKKVGAIEVRAVSGQEGFWIEELCNRDSRETPGGEEWGRGDGEGGEEDGREGGGGGVGNGI